MSKKSLVHYSSGQSRENIKNNTIVQSSNKLIMSVNNYIKMTGIKHNILSQKDYTSHINKGSRLIREENYTNNNTIHSPAYYHDTQSGSFMKLYKKYNSVISQSNPVINIYSTPVEALNIEMFENKTILVYSHYSKNGKIDSYNYYMINFFSRLVDTVFILSNSSKEKWSLPRMNVYILNYDFKSDFSNLYVFLLRYQVFIIKINRLFFINDSFLVADKQVFEHKIKDNFFSSKPTENYQGLILSNAHNIHYQSYFLCVKNTIINQFIDYFKKHKNPVNHVDAINKYELGLSRTFLNKNIQYICYNNNPTALYPYEIIKNYGIIKRQQLLSTYNIKSQLTYIQLQQFKNTYKDNNELIEFINEYSHT